MNFFNGGDSVAAGGEGADSEYVRIGGSEDSEEILSGKGVPRGWNGGRRLSSEALKRRLQRQVRLQSGERREALWMKAVLRQSSVLRCLKDFIQSLVAESERRRQTSRALDEGSFAGLQVPEAAAASSLPVSFDFLLLFQTHPDLGAEMLHLPQDTLLFLERHVLPGLCLRMLSARQALEKTQLAGDASSLSLDEKFQQREGHVAIEDTVTSHRLQIEALQKAPPLKVRLTNVPADEMSSKTDAS